MTKITEKDIVAFLKNKIISLQTELAKTEAVLAAITSTDQKPVNQTPGNAPSGVKRGRRPRIEINQTIEDIIQLPKTPKTRGKAAKTSTATKSGRSAGSDILTAPVVYAAEMTMQNKVAFALGKLGTGTKDDVRKVLADLEPGADTSKLDKDITVKLSALLSAGKIKADKSRRPYTYSLQ